MKIGIIVVMIAAVIGLTGIGYAEQKSPASTPDEFGDKTVNTVTGTAKSAVSETGNIAETSVKDPIAVPKTAIQAVKNTANTALTGADKAMKALTGEDQ